ncbi:unnamed protein product [Schistosoma margrebowiei]|uniref:Uncharacterized protein n=1 Tax=Schistosoma margrebowiei TaxID=48269 RepID=A0A3P7XN43_9TREM|nr:unnamed protein product [Schistosoma margrebowiei]
MSCTISHFLVPTLLQYLLHRSIASQYPKYMKNYV